MQSIGLVNGPSPPPPPPPGRLPLLVDPGGSPSPSLVYQDRARSEVAFHGHDDLDIDDSRMTMESVSDSYAAAQEGGFRSETCSVSSLAPGMPTTMGAGGQSQGGRAYMVLTETPDEPPSGARFLG
ncbi:hypothetical protein GUJ93_ZPchr0006g43805 [Zizania palustris]|uniref:Uncharacterized protein n=1 Tax=Zizania palustris TaxID=103762 RepID=A0A8J5SBV3_ZIZPA|nr:hypothetical protein GUJ93_ZPchr0006g43805 [Zizania palustris]